MFCRKSDVFTITSYVKQGFLKSELIESRTSRKKKLKSIRRITLVIKSPSSITLHDPEFPGNVWLGKDTDVLYYVTEDL